MDVKQQCNNNNYSKFPEQETRTRKLGLLGIIYSAVFPKVLLPDDDSEMELYEINFIFMAFITVYLPADHSQV